MALDYFLRFETDLSPNELVDLITGTKAVAREPLDAGVAFQFHGLSCACWTADAEDRSYCQEQYGFVPNVFLSARLKIGPQIGGES